jgi:hypothetical protein
MDTVVSEVVRYEEQMVMTHGEGWTQAQELTLSSSQHPVYLLTDAQGSGAALTQVSGLVEKLGVHLPVVWVDQADSQKSQEESDLKQASASEEQVLV